MAADAAAVVVRAALTLPAAVASSAALIAAILISPPLLILGQLVVLPLKRQLLTMRPRLEAEACRCQPLGELPLHDDRRLYAGALHRRH